MLLESWPICYYKSTFIKIQKYVEIFTKSPRTLW